VYIYGIIRDKQKGLNMKTNRWIWEKVKIELTNPQGETVILNSDSFDDYTFGIISEAVEKYVVDQGGELE
jgi:hypothetical protein